MAKIFFDTSVLLPVFLEDHEHHEASLKVFLKANRSEAACAAHSLAELYATATRLPGKHRLSGDQVMLFLDNVVERLTPIVLNAAEYVQAIQAAASKGIVSGTIYDALLAQCALKVGATVIYTWNVKHFRQLGPEIAKCVSVP